MDNQQTILFISSGFYFLYPPISLSKETAEGPLEKLETITNDNVTAYIDQEHFNLIPQSLFDESSISSYLELTAIEKKGSTPISNYIPLIDSTIIWTLNEEVKKKLIVNSPGIVFKHMLSLFINEKITQKKSPEIKIRIIKNSMYILCFNNGKLQLANRFLISGEDDAIYFTLLCAQHTKINKENTCINAKGEITKTFKNQLHNFFDSTKINLEETSTFQSFLS